MGQTHAGTRIEFCKEFDRELAPNPSFASGQAFYAVTEPDSGATRGTLQLQNEVLVPAQRSISISVDCSSAAL